MTTSEELAARVREDVDRNGDLIRKREGARRKQDTGELDSWNTDEDPQGVSLCTDCCEPRVHCQCSRLKRALRPITNTPTESVLGKAHRLVQGKRGAEYGHPLDNHTTTAQMFSAYLQRKYGVVVPLDADDTCWFNILQKASRDANEPREDNLVDTAGYAFNLELIRAERERRG